MIKVKSRQFVDELDDLEFSLENLDDARTTRTLRNIKKALVYSLKKGYKIVDNELTDEILKVHGLHKDNFDFINTFGKIMTEKLNDVSIDDNSNKNEKIVKGILQEVKISVDKAVGYDYLYRVLKELYGKKEAKRLSGKMYDYSLALSDSTNIMLPYCWSIDASKIVTLGKTFGQLYSKPAKRLDSYISVLNEVIHQMSGHLAGACLYKDQELILKYKNFTESVSIKSFVDKFSLDVKYDNYQGNWEYCDISNKNYQVLEDKGNFVKIKKVMRRKYSDDIYQIKTKSGKLLKVSKDHLFKVLYKGREIEVKAKDLKIYDTVFNTNLYGLPVDKNSKDYQLGQFHGIVAGDGNITEEYSIRISINYKQTYISDFLDKFLMEEYGEKGNLNKGNKCYTYHINSIKILNLLKNDIFKSGHLYCNKNIDIENKSLNYLAGFMDGVLVTDGVYNNSIAIALSNKDLICTLQNILKKFNINIKYREIEDKRVGNKRKTGYLLNIPIYFRKYLQLINIKIDESKNKQYKNIRKKDVAYFGNMAFSHSRGIKTNNKIKTYKERDIKKYDPVTDVVVEIGLIENDDVYVYEIETETNWYSTGGVLVHNCAIGSFFLDVAHLLLYKENYSISQIKRDKQVRQYIENQFQRIIHGVNSLSRNSNESPFSNISLFDRPKLRALISEENYGWYFPYSKKLILDDLGLDLEYSEKDWEKYVVEYIIELQSIYMNFFDKGDPSQGGMPYRFPVSTINLSKQWSEEEEHCIVEDKKFLKSICKKDIYRYNIFVSQGQKVSSCCRLLNDNELLELAGQSNSLGGGSSISLGSHRVLTTNFVRVALEAESLEDFFKILEDRVADSAKILKAHKQLLTLLTESGLQPFISNGWIQMSRLFSTFGILGVVEAEEILKKRFKEDVSKNSDLMEDILIFFNGKVSEYSKIENIIGNIEQIPGESMAVRLAKVDRLLYAKEMLTSEADIPWQIYSNQFIPLWDTESSIWERMDKDGKYNQLLTGGGIVHINTGEHVTNTQAEKLIEYSIGCGCEHFAITGTFIKCEDDHVVLGNVDRCPICGKDIIDKIARVVGFWTPVSSWNKSKIKYDHDRRKEYMNGDFDRKEN